MLAACGGGDDESSAKEEAISRADAICRDANSRVEDIRARTSTSPRAQAEAVSEIKRLGDESVVKLRAVEVPDEDRGTWDEFLSRTEQQVARLEGLRDAIDSGEQAQVREALEEVQRVDALANQAARDYGLEECGR